MTPKISDTRWIYRSGMGWRDLLAGLPLVAFFSFLLKCALGMLENIGEANAEFRAAATFVFLIFGLVTFFFVRLGVLLAFRFKKTIVDPQSKAVTVVEGVIFPWKRTVSPLTSKPTVELRNIKSHSPAISSTGTIDGRSEIVWRSEVRLRSKKLFKLEACRSASRATGIATSLTEFLQCEIVDKRKHHLMN